VIDPRSQDALMREPRTLVAGKYLVWIACMMFDRATIARHSPPVARWGSAGNQRERIMPAAHIGTRAITNPSSVIVPYPPRAATLSSHWTAVLNGRRNASNASRKLRAVVFPQAESVEMQ